MVGSEPYMDSARKPHANLVMLGVVEIIREQIAVIARSGNTIALVCPCTQVNQAAAVAAERPELIAAAPLHALAAGGAGNDSRGLVSH